MVSIDENAIRQDFLIWSGGFPPESMSQIFTYCEAARPSDTDFEAVFQFLRGWFDEEVNGDSSPVT